MESVKNGISNTTELGQVGLECCELREIFS